MQRVVRIAIGVLSLALAWRGDVAAQAPSQPPSQSRPVPPYSAVNWSWCDEVDPGGWVRFEYLNLTVKSASLPAPLATTGGSAGQGRLNAPDTTVLLGQPPGFGVVPGGRLTVGGWAGGEEEILGGEVTAFVTSLRAAHFNVASQGADAPLLAVPFANVTPNGVQESSLVVAQGGVRSGQIGLDDAMVLGGMECSALLSLTDFVPGDRIRLNLLGGVGFFVLNERMHFVSNSVDTLGVAAAHSDVFLTENSFFGGDFGARGSFRWRRFLIEVRNKPFLNTLEDLGYAEVVARRRDADLTPGDVLKAIRAVSQKISALLAKHQVLRGLRAVCVRYQEKWRRAGPMATLDSAALRGLIDILVRRHLVLRHADGALEIHPAVRDHFKQRAAADSAAWHDAIREQMLSLTRRPGAGLPEDPATLDLIEEAIHHAIEAGREDEAMGLYEKALGGHRHLAWKLGEIVRGLRIVRMFPKCPSRMATAWYLRSVGELDEAYRRHGMRFFRADIRLLQGRLPEAAGEGDPHRTALAAFLMGDTTRVPDLELGCPLPLAQLHLYLGRPDIAARTSRITELYGDFGWEGDRARLQLALADAELQRCHMSLDLRLSESRRLIDDATAWITHSGSMEHLAVLHLTRARTARVERDRAAQGRSIDDGLHVAGQCGFELFRIELLCERAILHLAEGRFEAAETQAREAFARTTAAECRFVWGAIEARFLLAEALAAQRRFEPARAVLAELHELRVLMHPRATDIQRLLESMP